MLVELTLLGGTAALWKYRKNKSLTTQTQTDRPFSVWRLLQDIRHTIKAEGRQQLQLDIDPKRQAALTAERQKNRREMFYSLGATGLALIGNIYPVFAVAGAVAVLYLSKELFSVVYKHFQRGHYFSVYLLSLVMILGMILAGHFVLAAFTGVMGSFFAGVVNRLEDSSQQQLISVFSGHPQKVWLLRDDVEVQIDFHTLQAGDIVIVNAGEVIPADGRIHRGEGRVDQHLLTGESEAVEKSIGENVYASTLLLSGQLMIEVATAGNKTMAAKIGTVLNQTQSYKDTLINRGQQISSRFLPIEVGIGVVTLPLLGWNAALSIAWSNLGSIMAPLGSLSVLSYLQIMSRHHILVKDGRIFESLRQVDTVVFDKTGTLTLEQPTVEAIHPVNGFDASSVLRYAAAAEYRQPHPVAKAIIAKAQAEQIDLPPLDEAHYEVGYGIKVNIEGQTIRVGSARFLQREMIAFPPELEGIQQYAEAESHTLIYVAVNQQLAGVLEMAPTLRPEAIATIEYLKQRGIKLYIISGDHEIPTRKMAETLGIDNYFAEVLPEHKADHVEQLKKQGRFVCFVGDGINDAIALKAAHISISLKGASTAATDTAQVIFMDGTLNHLIPLFQYSDEFEQTMDRNYVMSMAPGIIIIAGVYLLHFGIATSMGIFYIGCFAGLGNVLWPLIKHQDTVIDVDTSPAKPKIEFTQ